jgi:hypothetical protein
MDESIFMLTGVASGEMARTVPETPQILTNPKYIGDNVYNRVSFKLKKKRVVNPPEMWIKRSGAYEAIVEPSLFYVAQGILHERNHRFSDADLLDPPEAPARKRGPAVRFPD